MIGLVVAAHGKLAVEMVATAEQLIGPIDSVATCSVEPGASPEDIRANLKAAVAQVDAGEGVVVLADLIGGSPCTQTLTMCQQAKLEVITGVNLPMLLKANSLRGQQSSLPELAHELAAYGQKNITCASEAMRAQLARSRSA